MTPHRPTASTPHPSFVTTGLWILVGLTIGPAATGAAEPPLLSRETVAVLAQEVSGSEALRTVQELALHHRQRGSRGYRAAAEAIRDRARSYGLEQVEVWELPADGEIFYGTQRSRPAWDAEFAELWELEDGPEGRRRSRRVASWEALPISLAQDSASGRVEAAELVDVGEGTSESDYAGKDVRGDLVLAAAQPGPVAALAVERFGAAGIISDAQNQRSAWWKEDETLVRWGHLGTFPEPETFAFMVSLKQARSWRERLAAGEKVWLSAEVRAGQHPGSYDIPSAVIPGRDPQVAEEEIVFSCHLDHQQPGANDNASGCAAILEAARVLAKGIREGRLAPPRRTLRFIWPPEIEGTLALLNAPAGLGVPDLARRARAVIHMDMVGGDPATTKAVFHVTRSPASLPTFVNDVAGALADFVNAETGAFTATGEAEFPLVDPAGGKEPLRAERVDFTPGSDHQVWTEGSFRVPAIYLNDWPDRYIHTHGDAVGNLDATKLLRAAFLGAAGGYYLATLDGTNVPELLGVIRRHALARAAEALGRADRLQPEDPAEAANLLRFHAGYERQVLGSLATWATVPDEARRETESMLRSLGRLLGATGDGESARPGAPEGVVYQRAPEPRGTLDGFGYSRLSAGLERHGLPRPALLGYEGLWGDGYLYGYEALNLVDGRRSVQEIRDALSAIYGPVPLEEVVGFLETLETIGLLRRTGPGARR